MKKLFSGIINKIIKGIFRHKILIDKDKDKVDLKGLYKILIVDDEISIRESIRLILGIKYKGLYMKDAVDGKQALSILAQEQFDLMTTGIRMPNMNWMELLEKIKVKYPKMKRIVITAVNSDETRQKAKELGAIEYILKPFDIKELLNIFEKLRR